jgi:uncharacterized protein
VGASWEGDTIEQLVARLGLRAEQCFFWATHQGAGLDLLVTVDGKRIGFEVKRTSVPKVTRSMAIAMEDLGLDRLFAIFEGELPFRLAERIEAVPVTKIFEHPL